MKKAKYIIPIIFLVIGIILIIISAVLIANNIGLSSLETQTFSQSFESEQENQNINKLSAINAQCDIGNLVIKKGNELKIDCTDIIKNKLELYFSDGVLTVNYEAEKWHKYISVGFFNEKIKNGEIVITVPEGSFDELEIKGGVGTVSLSEITCKTADIDVGVGEFNIAGCNFTKSIKFSVGVGELDVKNSVLNNLTLENGVGESSFESCTLTGSSSLDNGIGEISMKLNGSREDYSFSIDNGIGEVSVDGENLYSDKVGGNSIVTIDNGIGEIDIDFE